MPTTPRCPPSLKCTTTCVPTQTWWRAGQQVSLDMRGRAPDQGIYSNHKQPSHGSDCGKQPEQTDGISTLACHWPPLLGADDTCAIDAAHNAHTKIARVSRVIGVVAAVAASDRVCMTEAAVTAPHPSNVHHALQHEAHRHHPARSKSNPARAIISALPLQSCPLFSGGNPPQ